FANHESDKWKLAGDGSDSGRCSALDERRRETESVARFASHDRFYAQRCSDLAGKEEGSVMSNFIHAQEFLHQGDIVVVECSHRCNVRLMDDANFRAFKSGQRHQYFGGHYTMLPARISVPHDGHWNITIDLGI